ncbi:MAG TPA: M50 family metallopeptidase [Herpetosiphonaceae bacterium]
MTAILWLLGVLAGLWLLGVLLSRHIQGLILLLTGRANIATMVYDLLVLPGVVLHELSHAAVALLLGLRVLQINLFQFRSSTDPRQGEVIVTKADPLRMSIVGAAPLLCGVAVLVLLLRWLDPPSISLNLAVFSQLWQQLREPTTAIATYFLFAIANTMFPSEADRRAWWVVGAVLLALGLVLLALGIRPTIPPLWVERVAAQSDQLVAALLPVAVIDVVVLVIVLMLETLVSRIRGRRVVYRTIKP